jgi:hypothetical protein
VLIAVAVAGGFGWLWWSDREGRESGVAACQPVSPSADFVASNPRGLQGELREDTLFKGGEEYTVAENAALIVPKGVTLLIEAGARVRFGQGAKLIVNGTLSACGTGSRRILFTADSSSGRPGYWAGIELHNPEAGTVLGHATFEFAGGDNHAALWIEGGNLVLDDLKFDSNQWYALSLDPDSAPQVRPPSTVENGPQGWELRGGPLQKTRALGDERPYIINGVLEVSENAKLTLAPGTWLKFQPGSALRIFGELEADGEAERKIIFTSANDGAEEGAPAPKAGDWAGLQMRGQRAKVTLSFAELRHAGGGAPCVWMENASPVLQDVTIHDCAAFSLSTDLASAPKLERLTLTETKAARRWEIREGRLEDTTKRTLSKITLADGALLMPTFTGWAGVSEGAKLTIEPGVTLLFDGGGLWAEGRLTITGTEAEPVTFTSARDPAVGGEGNAEPGDWAGLHLTRSQPDTVTVSHLTLRFGGAGEGGCLRLHEGASPTLTALTVSDCATYPISSDAAAEPVVSDLTLSDNVRANEWEIRESSLAGRREWTWPLLTDTSGSSIGRTVTGRVTINPEAMLRLPAGLALAFTNNAWLQAQGGLIAEGTAEQPIVFTSWRDPEMGRREGGAQPGDWAGLWLEGTQAVQTLRFVELRYAGIEGRGYGCLTLTDAAPVLADVTIRECGDYPVSSDLASDPQVERLTLANNRPADKWAIRESRLARGTERTLTAGDVPKLATGWLSVEAGARLSLAPGLTLKFARGAGLWVGGGLEAAGTADQPIILTSWRDPEFGREGGVQAGDWVGVAIENPDGDVQLRHTEIRYAGGERNPRGALSLTNASPRLSDVQLRDSAWYPLNLDLKSDPQLERVSLANSTPANAVEVRGSALDGSGERVWRPWTDAGGAPLIRVVTGQLSVGPQATLRLESVVVKFDANGSLDVAGGLQMEAATLTSLHDDEYGGDTDGRAQGERKWGGIKLRGRAVSQLQETRLRFAETGLWLEDAAPQLRAVQIEDSDVAALSADLKSAPVISATTLARNALNGLLIRADSLPDGETRWGVLGSEADQLVRVIERPLAIGGRSKLVVDPGVVVKFAPGAGLVVEGQLEAGVKGDSFQVTFTALGDNTIGGDTQPDAPALNRGTWLGIAVNPNDTGASLSLFGVNIRYAQVGLFLTRLTAWEFDSLTVSNSQLFGISCDALSFIPSDPQLKLMLVDNGGDTLICPTEGR